MTVLAWDGKTLAADKRGSSEYTHCTITKIFKHDHMLIGFSGEVSLGYAMRQWIVNGCKNDEFPPMQSTDENCEIIVITKQKRASPIVTVYEKTPFGFPIEDKFYACGDGRDFALAAMHCGKSAKESVLLASKLSTSCGNGIDTLIF